MNMIRYAPWIGWRTLARVSRHANSPREPIQSSSSSAFRINPSPSTASESHEKNVEKTYVVAETTKSEQKSEQDAKIPDIKIQLKSRSRSRPTTGIMHDLGLHALTYKENHKRLPVSTTVNDNLKSANTVESLLTIASQAKLSRAQCLTIVSTLVNWSNEKLIKMSSFDSDPRYLKICKKLGTAVTPKKPTEKAPSGHKDLEMVLEVTGNDEASRLISQISMSQTIKVMAALAAHGRRSLPLLQSLASNFARFDQVFNIKEGTDVLYAMSILNFPDDTLLKRVCQDLCLGLKTNTNPAIFRSIVKSLGYLRYKHLAILDDLSEWYVRNFSTCQSQDGAALLMTLAVLMKTPTNDHQLFDILTKEFNSTHMPTPSVWLDFVWGLVVLNQATPSHVKSILEQEFQNKLLTSSFTHEIKDLSNSIKRKLLNINAAAKLLIPNYDGPLLEDQACSSAILLKRSREKQILVNALFESLSNLLPSNSYLQMDTDMAMGFFVDGECIIDSKLNPLPLSDPTSLQKGKRIAIFAWSYDEMWRGKSSAPTGHANLAMRLTKASGYHILSVPFTKFNPQDKLITRVKYLEQELKMIATQ